MSVLKDICVAGSYPLVEAKRDFSLSAQKSDSSVPGVNCVHNRELTP